MKKSSPSLIVKEIQNQTMRCPFHLSKQQTLFVCLVLMLHINEDGGKSTNSTHDLAREYILIQFF